MLYKGFIGVKKAARPSEGSATEFGGLSALNLLLISAQQKPGKYVRLDYVFYKDEVEKQCLEQWLIFLFWRNIVPLKIHLGLLKKKKKNNNK